MSQKRNKILATALNEVGQVERPGNVIKYNDWFYGKAVKDGDKPGAAYPWCATFVSWVFCMSGYPLPAMGWARGFCSVPYAHKFWAARKRFTDKPERGDIVLFEFTGDKSDDHVGIFDEWVIPGQKFYAIEGNTSPNETGSQSNGGCVARKLRDVKLVSAFVKPEVFDEIN